MSTISLRKLDPVAFTRVAVNDIFWAPRMAVNRDVRLCQEIPAHPKGELVYLVGNAALADRGPLTQSGYVFEGEWSVGTPGVMVVKYARRAGMGWPESGRSW